MQAEVSLYTLVLRYFGGCRCRANRPMDSLTWDSVNRIGTGMTKRSRSVLLERDQCDRSYNLKTFLPTKDCKKSWCTDLSIHIDMPLQQSANLNGQHCFLKLTWRYMVCSPVVLDGSALPKDRAYGNNISATNYPCGYLDKPLLVPYLRSICNLLEQISTLKMTKVLGSYVKLL
jgi:hypothetical protein